MRKTCFGDLKVARVLRSTEEDDEEEGEGSNRVREKRADGAVKVIEETRRESRIAALDGEHAFSCDRIHDNLQKEDVATVALFEGRTAIRDLSIDIRRAGIEIATHERDARGEGRETNLACIEVKLGGCVDLS